MDPLKVIEIVSPYLEQSGFGKVVVICFILLLIATTIWVVAWMIDQQATKNLGRNLCYLVSFGAERFRKANKSPYDSAIQKSRLAQIIEFVYLYFVALVLVVLSAFIIGIALTVKSNVVFATVGILVFGAVTLVLARFAKVAADKAYYRFKRGRDWDGET